MKEVRLYYKNKAKEFLTKIFEKVKHGDEAHQKWLEDELNNWIEPLGGLIQYESELSAFKATDIYGWSDG